MRYRPSGRAVVIALWRANIKPPLEVVVDNLVTFHREEFSELTIPYDTVMTADFADSECEASAKSYYSARAWSARVL